MIFGALLVPAAAGAGGEPARNGPPNFQSDPEHARVDRERGAVLCSWMILTELKAIHRHCHADSTEIGAALDRSLGRFHTFIIANSAETRERLEAAVAHRLSEAQAQSEAQGEAGLCEGDGEEFYRFFTRDGAAGINDWTDRVLAVPRPPVLNPCL